MTPIETDISEYLKWMQIHNYARTTIAGRERYLGYLTCFLAKRGIVTCEMRGGQLGRTAGLPARTFLAPQA